MSEYKFELNLKQNTVNSEINKDVNISSLHNLLHNLDYESSGHIGFASQKELYANYPVTLDISQIESTDVVTIKLLNVNGEIISSKELDLNTEKIIENATLDYVNKSIVFELTDSTTINCDISAMIDDFILLVTTESERAKQQEKILSQNINTHIDDKSNPHNVTKNQLGLENVDNTSDLDKPVSNAQSAINTDLYNKIDDSVKYTNSTPTTISLGGIEKGTTFDNMKLTDIIENLLYPYVAFTFSSITLSGGTTYEYGTQVNVEYVRLTYTEGSKPLTNVSIVDENGNSLYNGEVSAQISISKQYDGTNGGTISATLTDEVNEVIKSASISYKYYNYYKLNSDETAPTTATKTTSNNADNTYTYSAGQYLYLYSRESNKKIQTYVLGTWGDVNMTKSGPITLTLESGITAQYYAYRTDKFTANGSARYRLS